MTQRADGGGVQGKDSGPRSARLGWHHFLFEELPRAWEVIGYTTGMREGRMVLADRRGEAMRVFWRAIKGEPALDQRLLRVASDYAGDSLTREQIRRGLRRVGGWSCWFPDGQAVRGLACAHVPGRNVLLYVVFAPRPDAPGNGDIVRVLKSYRPNTGPQRVWAAFGLDVELPEAYELARVNVFPGSQVLRFENRQGESVTLHRYGMLSLLLENDDCAAAFLRLNPGHRPLYRERDFQQAGRYPGLLLRYTTRGRGGVSSLLARTWQGRVWVWPCRELERLYAVDHNARERRLLAELPGKVRCL